MKQSETKRIAAPARVAGFGMYVPARVLTNADLARMVDTSDEWIVQRTGIHTRHVVSEGEFTSHLAFGAIDDLRAHHPEIDLAAIDYIIVSSTTPDYVYPSLAAMIQLQYGLSNNAGAIDISATCAGFAYAANLAAALISGEQASCVLIVAAESLSRSADYTDRSTCVLFGDGAGAAVIERSDVPQMFGMTAGVDGSGGPALFRTALRHDIDGVEDPSGLLRQRGADVYRWVIENIPGTAFRTLERAGMMIDDIDWFVPHSANLRMIEALNKRLGVSMEKTLLSIAEYGNTSAVSIPLALIPAVRDGRVRRGDRILVIGFGGGLVTAAHVLVY
ncbi:MAG TPA: beta-ketoacyl-ACP synthase 3, partial [Candidatus Baltobacteraceae bacterium]|nr:beta-ketoacyl-ACP synthase 3 [Candidatus Baltobacteraceae bacterium]